jgi:putative acetyltransferase
MQGETAIRDTGPADAVPLAALYPAAFPSEDLWPLVRALLQDNVAHSSLAAFHDGCLVGHVAFTICGIEGDHGQVALLGPLAVAPALQRRGIGRALVQAGLPRLAGAGCARVCVLGDPAYYGRLGFAVEPDILPPYPLPATWDGAWQSRATATASALLPCRGRLLVPAPWRQPALWAP